MDDERISYEDLADRLADAESMHQAIKDGKIDGVIGKEGFYLLRLKKMEEELKQSFAQTEKREFTLNTLMECVPVGITIADSPDVRIIRVSRYGKKLLGKSDEELENIAFDQHVTKWNIYEPDGRTKATNENLPLTRAIMKGEIVKDEEWMIVTADGSRIPILCNAAPIRDGAGKILGGVIVWRDISEQKKAEEKLRNSLDEMERQVTNRTRELAKRADQLSRLSSQLTLAEQTERRRIAKILHDHLQQFMVGAKLNQELLIGSIDDAHKQTAEIVLDLINRSIRESRSLTAELSPPALASGNLSASLQWLAQWMRENQGFEVKLDIETGIVPSRKDITVTLFQSVKELLFNALKHSGERSATVEMTKKDKELRILVRDRGMGFDSATIWKEVASGNKIGLFSIRERLTNLGVLLKVESIPDAGSTISMTVPLDEKKTAEKTPTPVAEKDPLEKTVATSSPKDKIRVLIADDHGVVRQGLSAFLGMESDIEIAGEATDGEKAVHLARKIIPDVILMDINMPAMDGLEATRIIHSEFPEIRIIGLSLYEESDHAAAMIRAGATAYRSKSDNMDLLLSTIRDTVH